MIDSTQKSTKVANPVDPATVDAGGLSTARTSASDPAGGPVVRNRTNSESRTPFLTPDTGIHPLSRPVSDSPSLAATLGRPVDPAVHPIIGDLAGALEYLIELRDILEYNGGERNRSDLVDHALNGLKDAIKALRLLVTRGATWVPPIAGQAWVPPRPDSATTSDVRNPREPNPSQPPADTRAQKLREPNPSRPDSATASATDVESEKPLVVSVAVKPTSLTLSVGDRRRITTKVLDGQGNTVTGRAVQFSSNDSAVATVDQAGVVNAVADGSTSIVVTCEGHQASVSVSVSVGA